MSSLGQTDSELRFTSLGGRFADGDSGTRGHEHRDSERRGKLDPLQTRSGPIDFDSLETFPPDTPPS